MANEFEPEVFAGQHEMKRRQLRETALVALGGILSSNVQNQITMKGAAEMAWEVADHFTRHERAR